VNGEDAVDRFCFDQKAILKEQVKAERVFTNESFVGDDNSLLIRGVDPAKFTFS
jgi:hypothetical protein